MTFSIPTCQYVCRAIYMEGRFEINESRGFPPPPFFSFQALVFEFFSRFEVLNTYLSGIYMLVSGIGSSLIVSAHSPCSTIVCCFAVEARRGRSW